MITKKNLVVIILTTFLLSSFLSMIAFTKSTETNEFDIWADINCDGTVNILDAILLAKAYGTSAPAGDAINKTELLLQCNATYTSLMSRMDTLNASFIDLLGAVNGMNATNLMSMINDLNASFLQLQSNMTALNTTVTQLQASNTTLWTSVVQLQAQVNSINNTLSTRMSSLESQVATMNTTIAAMNATITAMNSTMAAQQTKIDNLNATITLLLNALDYTPTIVWDSGWMGPTIVGDTTFYYGKTLNITNAMVYMEGRETLTGDSHIFDYGGYFDGLYYHGAYWWKLESTSITFHRHGNDSHWNYVRIIIMSFVRAHP